MVAITPVTRPASPARVHCLPGEGRQSPGASAKARTGYAPAPRGRCNYYQKSFRNNRNTSLPAMDFKFTRRLALDEDERGAPSPASGPSASVPSEDGESLPRCMIRKFRRGKRARRARVRTMKNKQIHNKLLIIN